MSIRYLEAGEVTLPARAPLFVEEGHCQWCNKKLTGKATRYCRGSEKYVYGDGYGNNLYSECAIFFLNWWCSRPAYVRATFIKNNFTCQKCGFHSVMETRPWLPDISQLECDHIIPVAKGGKTEMDNLQTLCRKCNREKGTSVPVDQAEKVTARTALSNTMKPLVKAGLEPLCGWPWLEGNKGKVYPEQSITVFFNGKALVAMPSTATKPGLIKAAIKMAVRTQ